MTGKTIKLGGSVIGLAALFVILIAVNLIVRSARARVDLTEERIYTLSPGSRRVLEKLDKPVSLKFFFNRSSPDVPSWLKNFASEVEDMLREIEIASNGKVTVNVYDPKPDSDEEDWAHKFGIQGAQMAFMGPPVYLGVAATAGEQQAVIPAMHPDTENLLEYNLMRLIHRVAHPEKPVVGVMSSLPVLGSQMPPFAMPGQPPPQNQKPWLLFGNLKQDYDVREVPTTADTINDEIGTLIIVHPKELSERTQFAIDQFLLRGGKILAFLDPFSVADPEASSPGQFGGGSSSSDLGKLLPAWGVAYDASQILADMSATTPLRNRGNDPTYLSLAAGSGHMNSNDLLTAGLELLHVPLAGVFGGEGIEGVKVTPLLTSSPDSDLVNSFAVRFSPDALRRQFTSRQKTHNIAERLLGKFKTAFPDGAPAKQPTDEKEESAPASEKPEGDYLKESAKEGAVILVGDVDMLLDDVCVEVFQVFGSSAYRPKNDNMSFFDNAVEQLAGSTELIDIRTRGSTARPFHVVDQLEMRAQERWLEEEQQLQTKLEATRSHLRDLQTEKTSSQRDIISPEQKAAIERFRAEETETAHKLKNVQKELRRDIDKLGVRIKAINIVAMPLLVCAAGVAFGLHRRSRMKQS